ncbi:MAG TPA: molybdenum cofactor biosynthesis protein MoaE [Longimicrobiales bacterium]
MIYVDVSAAPIVEADVRARVGAPEDGAVLLFLGTVRDHNDGRPVERLHYDAYRDMAVRELRAIAEEAAARTGTDRIVVIHRTGTLEIGEASLAVAVSTPHRAEAFDAARFIIEEIKKRVPVWKKEHYAGAKDPKWLPGAEYRLPSTVDRLPGSSEVAGREPGARG